MGEYHDSHRQNQKKTLLSFLKIYLESEKLPGLSWINKDKEIWKLPWKIHRPTVWGEPDAKVLHAWAIYKYNYQSNEPSRKELSKWKENLRNSILTCPSIIEIEDGHEQKVPEPYKVYQFIGCKTKSPETNRTVSHRNHYEGSHLSQSKDRNGAENSNLPNFSVLTQSNDLSQFSLNHYPLSSSNSPNPLCSTPISDLDYIKFEDLIGSISNNKNLQSQDQVFGLQIGGLHIDDNSQLPCKPNGTQALSNLTKEREIIGKCEGDFRSRSPVQRSEDNLIRDPINYVYNGTSYLSNGQKNFTDIDYKFNVKSSSVDMAEALVKTTNKVSDVMPLSITVYYVFNQVMHEKMNEKFKLCYVDSNEMRNSILQCPTPAQFGPHDAFLVELPCIDKTKCLKADHSEIVLTVLKHMKRGLTISYFQGDIFVTRYCKAVANFRAKTGEQVKLERNQTVKVFDFQEFKSQFCQSQWSCLTPDVKISFGVKSSSVEVVSVTITHREAQKMLHEKCSHELQVYTEADCSLSNEFDTRLSIEQKLLRVGVELELDT